MVPKRPLFPKATPDDPLSGFRDQGSGFRIQGTDGAQPAGRAGGPGSGPGFGTPAARTTNVIDGPLGEFLNRELYR